MNRIDTIFQSRRENGQRTLMPFICAGYPLGTSLGQILPRLQGAGASIVEIGFPFSDPVADGPVIAAAMHEALASGVTPDTIFEEVRQIRPSLDLGLVSMVSMSIVHRVGGPFGFVQRAVEAGFDGFIFPDAPLEESDELLEACRQHGATASLLIAPTSNAERIRMIAEACTGFVYVLARSGITGARTDRPEVESIVQAVRRCTQLPIACGFGISTADHVREVVRHADAAIVGSALVRAMGDARSSGTDPVEAAERLVRELSGVL